MNQNIYSKNLDESISDRGDISSRNRDRNKENKENKDINYDPYTNLNPIKETKREQGLI